jgi:hypothetical protein
MFTTPTGGIQSNFFPEESIMSEVKLVVRDATRNLTLTCHGSDAERFVAALSADPVTIEELEVALQRFMNSNPYGFWRSSSHDYLDDEPWDAGLVVIDLAARLIVIDSTYSWMGHTGQVFYQNGDYRTNINVGYSLADDWEISDSGDTWRYLAYTRRKERLERPCVDVRPIFYGRPLLEFLATECWTAFPQVNEASSETEIENVCDDDSWECTSPSNVNATGKLPPLADQDEHHSANVVYETLKNIHARWLLTPREDLQSKTPREVMLSQREHLSLDMQQRCDQWSHTQECPRGLDATSHAYRFGGFGTHEVVKYYEMVRELLWSCWDRLTELAQADGTGVSGASIGFAKFLEDEVPRLEGVRDEWLQTPDPECHLRTPQSIIDRERARLPEAISGHDAMIDPDCPCCQMMAELPGPMFWHLDGSGMDWEFAFDMYCRTREEWDAEQKEFAEFSKQQLENDAKNSSASTESCSSKLASNVWK